MNFKDSSALRMCSLLQELQTLQEENRRLSGQAGSRPGSRPGSASGSAVQADMVDNVLLQNQVDTLQWQLRQVRGVISSSAGRKTCCVEIAWNAVWPAH